MTYAENILKNTAEVNYLIIIGVAKEYDITWDSITINGEDVWRTSWEFGFPTRLDVFFLGELAQPNGHFEPWFSHLDDGFKTGKKYSYDYESGYLYVNRQVSLGGSLNLNSADVTTRIFRPYFLATKHASWNIVPTDDRFAKVQYLGLVDQIPSFVSDNSDSIFGAVPSHTLSMSFVNEGRVFGQEFFSDFAITDGSIDIYRMVGEFDEQNCIRAFTGFLRGVNFNESSVNISFIDMSSSLDSDSTIKNLDNSLFTYLEDQRKNAQRQIISGNFTRSECVNVIYSDTKANTTNRTWSCARFFAGPKRYGSVYQSTPDSSAYAINVDPALAGSNTTTRSYLLDTKGIVAGDWVRLVRSFVGYPATVTGVGANYIDFTPALPSAQTSTEQGVRFIWKNVRLISKKNGVITNLAPTDFDLSFYTPIDFTFRMNTSVESTYSLPDFVHPEDYWVSAEMLFGSKLQFLGTGDILGDRSSTNWGQNPAQILFSILYEAGFLNDGFSYDQDSFVSVADDEALNTSLMTPILLSSPTEKFREPISKICETFLLKLYTKNGKWRLSKIKPVATATRFVEKSDIIGGISYRVSTDDLCTSASLLYDFGEFTLTNNKSEDSWRQITSNSVLPSYGAFKKVREIKTCHDSTNDLQLWANRYSFLFGAPMGFMNLRLGLPFIDITMDDVIEFDPTGFDNLPFSTPKKFSVIGFTENYDSIDVVLFDQRGIEENSGDWT